MPEPWVEQWPECRPETLDETGSLPIAMAPEMWCVLLEVMFGERPLTWAAGARATIMAALLNAAAS